MPETILMNTEERMEHTMIALHKEFTTVRSGRSNPKMLERIVIDYYGVETPINQIASITTPEGNQIYVKPYDKSQLSKIEKALYAANVGATPGNDGQGIRLSFPPLTEETRKLAAKQVHIFAENAKIAIRNIRRDAIADFKKLEKEKLLTEDDLTYYEDETQKLHDKFIVKIDAAGLEKEREIMHI